MREKNILPLARRQFLSASSTLAGLSVFGGVTGLSLGGCSHLGATNQSMTYKQAWAEADHIVKTTVVPKFQAKDFDLLAFGAVTDGKTDASAAFAAAISACNKAGGGRVVVKSGTYFTGPIHLLSNVNLHLEEGAHILFNTDPKAYLPAVFTRWEGMELMGYSPLIYAYRQKNIAITGKGTLDGQANRTTWWPWKGGDKWQVEGFPTQAAARAKLQADMEANVPVAQRIYAEGANFRPPFVQPYECENVLVEGVTIINSPFWLLNPVLCKNVTVQGVTLSSLGPNSDGCDPESCQNVIIDNCLFETGDDCIAIKSGRNEDGRRIARPSENIVIRNCKMRDGHGGVVIGSEMSGGVRNVFVENCEMSSPELERGLRIKTNSVRGGVVENFFVRNVTIGEVQTAIVIDFDYEEGDSGNFTPTVRNIDVHDLICKKSKQVFQVRGYKRSPISNFSLRDSKFESTENIGILENLENFSTKQVTINGAPFIVSSEDLKSKV